MIKLNCNCDGFIEVFQNRGKNDINIDDLMYEKTYLINKPSDREKVKMGDCSEWPLNMTKSNQ